MVLPLDPGEKLSCTVVRQAEQSVTAVFVYVNKYKRRLSVANAPGLHHSSPQRSHR